MAFHKLELSMQDNSWQTRYAQLRGTKSSCSFMWISPIWNLFKLAQKTFESAFRELTFS